MGVGDCVTMRVLQHHGVEGPRYNHTRAGSDKSLPHTLTELNIPAHLIGNTRAKGIQYGFIYLETVLNSAIPKNVDIR